MACGKVVTGCGVSNCWVCEETTIEVVTAGLDSGIIGRANGNVEMV